MKNLMFIVGALCIICAGCANANVEKSAEEPSRLVKQLVIDEDGDQTRTIDFKYDESGRLVEVSTVVNAGTKSEFTEKATVSYTNGAIVCEGAKESMTLNVNSEGFVQKREVKSEDTLVIDNYEYKSGKLASCGKDDCGRKYIWDGDNISKVTAVLCDEDLIWYDTIEYKYSDVIRPSIDILAFSGMFGGFPGPESVASKGIVSKYMPSEVKVSNYDSEGALNSVSLLTCNYSTDKYGRIESFDYKYSRNNGSEFEENTNVTVKVVY